MFHSLARLFVFIGISFLSVVLCLFRFICSLFRLGEYELKWDMDIEAGETLK